MDCRGNVWRVVGVRPEQQRALQGARADWYTASDEEIAAAKTAMLALFDDPPRHVKGMPCHDFIYLCTEAQDRHFFVPTSGHELHALSYEGECGMQFAPFCTFDVVKMQHLDAVGE